MTDRRLTTDDEYGLHFEHIVHDELNEELNHIPG